METQSSQKKTKAASKIKATRTLQSAASTRLSRSTRRIGPTRIVCKQIRSTLDSNGIVPKTFTLNSGKRQKLDGYSLAKEAHFGLDLDESVCFRGLNTLPSDHLQHDQIVEQYAVKGLPSADILGAADLNYVYLGTRLRDYVKSKIDVDTRKLSTYPFSKLIVQAQQQVLGTTVGTKSTTASTATASTATEAAAESTASTEFATLTGVLTTLTGAVNTHVNHTKDGFSTLTGALNTHVNHTNDGFSTLTGAVTTLTDTVAKGFAKHDQHLQKHDSQIYTIKATLDHLTTSAKKIWGYNAPNAATSPYPMPAGLFSGDSPSIASASLQSVDEHQVMDGIELSDLSTEKPNFLMEGLDSLLQPGVDLDNHTSLTRFQIKHLKDIQDDLKGSSLVSLKKELSEADFIVMKTHVSSLTQLESLSAFVSQLESSILVIPNPQNRHDAVFVLPGHLEIHGMNEFLPAVAGVDVVVDIMGDDDDNVTILTRNSNAAVPVMTALFQLAAKGSTKTLDLEASYKDDQKRGKRVPLPLPSDALDLSRSFQLGLQAFSVTSTGQATILGSSFSSVLLNGCSMDDPLVVDAFLAAISSHGGQPISSLAFSVDGLVAPSNSLVKLARHVLQHNKGPKLVFDDKSFEKFPQEVLSEIAKHLVKAWQTSDNLSHRLEIDAGAFSGGNPFLKVVKTCVEQTHPRFNIVQMVNAEAVFPKSSGITGSKSKKAAFAKKVKEWLASFETPSNKRKDAPPPSTPVAKAPRHD